jgi:HlyD family secretion protein
VTRRKGIVLSVVVVLAGAAAGVAFWANRPNLPEVAAEAVRARDLEAIVSASGKIQPKRQVNVSANTMGKVTRVAVEEGQRVRAGQFLLEIDPRSLEGQLQRGEASVAAARSSLQQARTGVEQARVALDLSRQTLKRQQELWSGGLTSREALERAQNDVEQREAELKAREQEIQTREQQIRQEQAGLTTTRYNLSQVIINSPMDGIVTRRNIEEGETAVVGTMNNAGTVLLTIADMSVIEAEVEVDETDIPTVTIGQQARVTIDAVPDRTFRGHVTEIGNSPIQQTGAQAATQQQATNFKVVITLDEEVPDIRPGFTCTAEITTATRTNVLAVPIQALRGHRLGQGEDDRGLVRGFDRGDPAAEDREIGGGGRRVEQQVEGELDVRRAERLPVVEGDTGFEGQGIGQTVGRDRPLFGQVGHRLQRRRVDRDQGVEEELGVAVGVDDRGQRLDRQRRPLDQGAARHDVGGVHLGGRPRRARVSLHSR